MECSEIVRFLEELAPKELAEDWDNTGLLLGSMKQKIDRILVCLDVTSDAVNEAIDKKVDLIVSHHPLIFENIKRINEDDITGKIIYKLIIGNVGVYSAHTNLDIADGGVNDCLASVLGLTEIKNLNIRSVTIDSHPYEEAADDIYQLKREEKEYGLGKVGLLPKPIPLSEFILHVKNTLCVNGLRLIGDCKEKVKKVAVFSGSFDGDFSCIKRENADVLVTGEIKYHDAVAAAEKGLCVIEAGHYATEVIIVNELTDKLAKRFPDIEVISTGSGRDPLIFI